MAPREDEGIIAEEEVGAVSPPIEPKDTASPITKSTSSSKMETLVSGLPWIAKENRDKFESTTAMMSSLSIPSTAPTRAESESTITSSQSMTMPEDCWLTPSQHSLSESTEIYEMLEASPILSDEQQKKFQLYLDQLFSNISEQNESLSSYFENKKSDSIIVQTYQTAYNRVDFELSQLKQSHQWTNPWHIILSHDRLASYLQVLHKAVVKDDDATRLCLDSALKPMDIKNPISISTWSLPQLAFDIGIHNKPAIVENDRVKVTVGVVSEVAATSLLEGSVIQRTCDLEVESWSYRNIGGSVLMGDATLIVKVRPSDESSIRIGEVRVYELDTTTITGDLGQLYTTSYGTDDDVTLTIRFQTTSQNQKGRVSNVRVDLVVG